MSASSAPAVKANLRTILAARPGLAGVQIEYAQPVPLQQEAIWFGKVELEERDQFLRPSPRAKQEDYTVECIVFVVRDGDDSEGAEVRWWQILSEIEAALQADVTVGGAVNQWAGISAVEQRPTFPEAGGGRVSEGEVSIACSHRK